MIVYQFEGGNALLGDATCCDTFSKGYLIKSVTDPTKQAEDWKLTRYYLLLDRLFIPIAVETSGVLGLQIAFLLHQIDSKIADFRNEPWEVELLFQRIFLTVLRSKTFVILSIGIVNQKWLLSPYFWKIVFFIKYLMLTSSLASWVECLPMVQKTNGTWYLVA